VGAILAHRYAFAEITERMELARHGAHTFWAC
jgi:hypothetical protein